MRKVVLEADLDELQDHVLPGRPERIAVAPMKLYTRYETCDLTIPYLLSKASCKGQQLDVNVTGHKQPHYQYWGSITFAILMNVLGMLRHFHSVRIRLRIPEKNSTERTPRQSHGGGLTMDYNNLLNLQREVVAALGPGVRVEEKGESHYYCDCMEYRPRL